MYKDFNLFTKILTLCFILCGTIFANSELFMDAQNTPKQLFGKIGVSLFAFYYAYSILSKKDRIKNDKFDFYTITCFIIITTIEATYGIIWFIVNSVYSHKLVPTFGSFNNSAGFAALLSSIYPYNLYLLLVIKSKNRLYIYISTILIFIAMFVSASRSGILCITSISLLYILYRKKKSYHKIAVITIISICILTCILYIINRNSANGRLFIWTRSFELINKNPFWGYGTDAFKTNYMTHQAKYFEANPNSQYSLIADNVQYPYNELINLMLNFGLAGLFLLIIIIICIIICYKKNYNSIKPYTAMSILSIALFSLFSYPSFYTCIWIIIIFNVHLIIKPLCSSIHLILEKLRIKRIWGFCIIAFSIIHFYNCILCINTELRWKETHNLYIKKRNNSLFEYQKLYNKLKNNPSFLFNYASILYEEGKYNDSYIVAKQAKALWKNYEIELLLGNIEDKRNNPYKAIEYYVTASNMCPAKFHPLVQIQQLYKNVGDTISANEYAIKIINKPVKIKSPKIELIKELMKYELR